MIKRILLLLVLLTPLVLLGCDNDDGSLVQPGTGDADNGDDPGNGDDPDDDDGSDDGGDAPQALMLGSGEGDDFEEGQLALDMETISSGGSTSVSGRLVDEDGDPAAGDYEVEFNSNCIADERSEIDSPVSVINGEFSATYSAVSCSGDDTIVGSVDVDAAGGSTTFTATATVQIEPAELGSIGFVGANPTSIGIRGMGGVDRSETSRVEFQVRDVTGSPVADETVNFLLSTQVGGIELSNESAVSNAQGMVSTNVQSGTQATSVRVNASIEGSGLSTQSDQLSISTGIPTDEGFSISASTFTPEALACDGEEVDVTVRSRDRFSNPVVDGTTIQFSAEGGSIEPSCVTEGGACTVTWTSQNPRPDDGRVSILAFAVGEESFVDMTGDGRFGDTEFNAGNWTDRGEPFRDDTESGTFEPGQDGFFFDFDGSESWTGPNSLFDGLLCEADGGCGESLTGVGYSFVMVMSGNTADINFPTGPSHEINEDGSQLTVQVQDTNGNAMPGGTTVTLTDLEYGEVVGPDSFEFPSNATAPGPYNFHFNVAGEDEFGCGTALVEVESPGSACGGGVITTSSIQICQQEVVEPGDPHAVVFMDAEPQQIALQGMGGVGIPDSSQATFQVRDDAGVPVAQADVNFSLSTEVGGIELSTTEATSDTQGMVTTTVTSGSVATPVRVGAELVANGAETLSDLLSISTGIPEDRGFSVASAAFNVEAFSCDGEETEITVRARDRHSNPVVDGTAIQFSTEGGTIEPSCQTADGACTVTWTSQDPRPSLGPVPGRSAVLAYAIGEESFIDISGDGRFGDEEATAGSWTDIGEPFRDDTESGAFDPGQDGFFYDFDNSGDWTGPNNAFDGVLCDADDAFCGANTAGVGKGFVVVMSTSDADVTFPSGPSHSISGDGSTLTVEVQDLHGNPMPRGTTVSITDMQYGSVFGPDSFSFGSTNALGPFDFDFILEAEEDPGCGLAILEVATPGNACGDGTTTVRTIEICD